MAPAGNVATVQWSHTTACEHLGLHRCESPAGVVDTAMADEQIELCDDLLRNIRHRPVTEVTT